MTELESDTLSQLRGMLSELFQIEAERIVPNARLVEDLELDSIDAIDMVVKLQELTGRRVSEDELRGLRTVADVVTLVRSCLPPLH
jgi:acyl carrier protein